MPEMDKGGQQAAGAGAGELVPATVFAQWTGVSRERLRTWERRFGFPRPVRRDGGPRRYRTEDTGRVVAVRRAVGAGVPLPIAIAASAVSAERVQVGPQTLAAVARSAPMPVVLLTGPRPLRVAWANAAAALAPGTDLELAVPGFAGHPALDLIRRVYAPSAAPVELEHPAWDGAAWSTRSIAFPLPGDPDAQPVVALVALAGEGERRAHAQLGAVREDLATVNRHAERHSRWLDAIAHLATEFQRDPGPGIVDSGLDALIRSTNAVDAGLAAYRSGQLELPGSRRGLVTGGSPVVAAHPALVRALRDHEGTWLDAVARAALGVPRALEASFVPVVVGGEPLGALITCFNEVEPHDPDNRRLLAALSATFGFAMLRDRLTAELAEAARRR